MFSVWLRRTGVQKSDHWQHRLRVHGHVATAPMSVMNSRRFIGSLSTVWTPLNY